MQIVKNLNKLVSIFLVIILIIPVFSFPGSALAIPGDFIWAKSMGSTSSDVAHSVATDSVGNVYTVGYFRNTVDFDPGVGTANLVSAGNNDIFISKLDSSGNFIWAKSMGGGSNDRAYSVTIDSSDNVYTTGLFSGTADFDPGAGTSDLISLGSTDVFISKLDSSGNFLWAKSVGGTSVDEAYSITTDSGGNVYTTGSFYNTVDFDPGAGTSDLISLGLNDIFILKLNSSGDFVWAGSMGDLSADRGNSIAIDSSDNVYTTGLFNDTVDFDPGAGTSNLISAGFDDIFISKLDSSGNFVWAKSIGGTGFDVANSIILDGSDNVYITGSFNDTVDFDPGVGTANLVTAGDYDIFISKLNSSGDYVLAKSIGGTSTDYAYSITTDSVGNIYTTGFFYDTVDFDPGAGTSNLVSVGNADIFISKLNSSGDFVWAKNVGGTSDDGAQSISIDSSDDIYITGYFRATADFDPGAGTSNLVFAGGAGDDAFILKLGDLAPTLTEVTPVPTVLVNQSTPSYTFNTDQEGDITYGGSCTSATTTATVGNNTITFNTLTPGTYDNCTITVTDVLNNVSTPLSVSAFSIVVHSGGGGSTPTEIPTTPTETPTTPIIIEPVLPEPEIVIPIETVAPIVICNEGQLFSPTTGESCTTFVPTVLCSEGQLFNTNTGEACTVFVPTVLETIQEPVEPTIEEKPKKIIKPKEIIAETQEESPITEVVIPVSTDVDVVSTTQENTNNTSTTNTLQENNSNIPSYSETKEGNAKLLNVLKYINEQAEESFQEAVNIINKGKEKIKEILETKEGDVASKAITIGGVVVGTTSVIASIAFATPLSFSEIPLIPLRMWTLFLGFVGIKKRTRRWGVVYDSLTKQPLDPAYVTLKNTEGQTVATTITDIDGRYGFAVDKGMYTIHVDKTNYIFPSMKLSGKTNDELYDSLYLGDMVNISTPDEVVAKNIPLDRVNFSWNESEKEKKRLTNYFNRYDLLISKISSFLFAIGFLIALIALFVAPEPYNGIILALYFTIFTLKMVGVQTKNKGSVIEKATGLPLSNGIVRLFYTDIGQEIAHALIDKSGKFYCLVKNGTYKVQIDKKNTDGTYTPVYQQSLVTVTNGVLNMGFRV